MYIDTVQIHSKHFPRDDKYPFNVKPLRGSRIIHFRSPVVFLVGENGTGKSTFLEALARKFGLTVWGGEKTHILHRNPFETRLYDFLDLRGSREPGGIRKGFLFRAENFFNYACNVDDMIMSDAGMLKYYGGKSLHQKSHGESFLSFFEHRCRIDGLYLFDEPEAALSPSNQLAFLKLLYRQTRSGDVQFIISTHSPIILSYPAAQILSFDYVPIQEIEYEETSSYRFYAGFIANRQAYLEALNNGDINDNQEGKDAQGKS